MINLKNPNIKYILYNNQNSRFHSEVYKRMGGYWLKISPWNNKEDRRVSDDYFKTNKIAVLPKKRVNNLLNNAFNTFEDIWQHKGYFYKTLAHDTLSNTETQLKIHKFNEYPFANVPFYLIYHQGDLYWAQHCYDDKYRLYEFKDENIMPDKCIGYYSANSLKPIYKLDKVWEVI